MEELTRAFNTCLRAKYATFSGRAGRPEFWWFMLPVGLAGALINLVNSLALSFVFLVVFLLPVVAVSTRRLHDINRTGWWQLLALIPVVGALVLLYFYIQKSTAGPNRFGA